MVFEGAQGILLDVDHGTYPYVTSSNTVAAAAATGSGCGPNSINYVLGITKAYTTRVGEGPMPTEIEGSLGEEIAKKGGEVGATTGRPRRCGWFDAVSVQRIIQSNSVSALCLTKIDVLDGFESIKICTEYEEDEEYNEEEEESSDDDYEEEEEGIDDDYEEEEEGIDDDDEEEEE